MGRKTGRKTGPKPRPVLDRIADKVAFDGECLLWLGARCRKGYARIGIGSLTDGTRRVVQAHRVVYEEVIGPIPDGLEVDHVAARGCRHKHCVRPEHLEAVTPSVNMQRRWDVMKAVAS